jgi:cell division protease FtsH
VSIIPRGMALGVTLSAPANDRFSYDERYLRTKIRVALGGRVAEDLVFGDMTTGAESDIQQLTEIARRMVGRWGMSEAIGPITVLPSEPNGLFLPGASETSAETQRIVDEEVRRIVEGEQRSVAELLTEHRASLDSLVEELLVRETLDEDDAYRAAGIPHERGSDREEPPLELTPGEPPTGTAAGAGVATDTTPHGAIALPASESRRRPS